MGKSVRSLVLLAAAPLVLAAVAPPAGASYAKTQEGWATVAVGTWHSCGIRLNGTLWCWGADKSGELGDGGRSPQFHPVQVGTRTDWVAVMAGHNTGCAIPEDGSLWCWGRGDHGQLGNGDTGIVRTPVRVATATDTGWLAISGSNGGYGYATDSHTCGVRADGTAWCWGQNDLGQVGNGTQNDQLTPTRVGRSNGWTSVSAGNGMSCGTRAGGGLWCWGTGDLGNGANERELSPVRIGTSSHWATVSVGAGHTCGTRTDGTLWCWGWNGTGAVGDGTTTERFTPVQVGTKTTWVSVTAGSASTCGTRADGAALCWGANASGQLGNGTQADTTVPVKVEGGPPAWSVDVTTRYLHSCGVGRNHTLWCWGFNKYGEVGSGTGREVHLPAHVKVP
ncbi:MAG: RCC1 domain-containing protein [Nocardioidaceae bacterium]